MTLVDSTGKYTGKIVVDLLRICAAECHIDCQRHIYPARIHEVIHDPHKNYTYGIELFIPELKQTITHNLAVTYEDFIMHIYTVTGIFLDHTTEHYNPFYLPLPAIVFIIFALKLTYRRFLPICLKRFFRKIFKFFLGSNLCLRSLSCLFAVQSNQSVSSCISTFSGPVSNTS